MGRTEIKIGQYFMPFGEYLALDAWGSGSLKAMRRGPPARVVWEREVGRADTDATILGTAVHCRLLTPDLYAKQYAIKPDGMSFSTKEGKAWRDSPERAGSTLLSYEVGEKVSAIVAAIKGRATVATALRDAGAVELSLVWRCSTTGEMCKGRPDWIKGRYIYDVKVSRYAQGGYLALRAYSEGWMHQLAHYRTGAVELGFQVWGGRLVVVEPVPPHFVYTLEVKRDALDLLEIENIETLKLLRECRASGVWPGTPDEWVKIEPPAAAGLEAMNEVVLYEGIEEAELD